MVLPVVAYHLYQLVNLCGRHLGAAVGGIYKNIPRLLNRYVSHIIHVVRLAPVRFAATVVIVIRTNAGAIVNIVYVAKQAPAIRVYLYLGYYPVRHPSACSCKYCFHW